MYGPTLYWVIVQWQSWSCSCCPLQQSSSTDTNVSHVTCGFVRDTKEQDTKLTTPAIVLTLHQMRYIGVLVMLWLKL